jgi:hypothetical protein
MSVVCNSVYHGSIQSHCGATTRLLMLLSQACKDRISHPTVDKVRPSGQATDAGAT